MCVVHISQATLTSPWVCVDSYRSKEAALNDIFSWKLVPDELYSQQPVQPSLVCGAQHFMRLFGQWACVAVFYSCTFSSLMSLVDH